MHDRASTIHDDEPAARDVVAGERSRAEGEPQPAGREPVPISRDQPALTGSQLENVSLTVAAAAMLVGAVVGLSLLRDFTPFRGDGWRSVGHVACVAAGLLAGVAFPGVLLRYSDRIMPWFRDAHPLRRAIQLAGLSLMMGSLTFFCVRAANTVIDAAFVGLRFDVWSGTTFLAFVCAASGYFAASAAGRLTTELLSVLVSAFLVMGAMLSAVNASNHLWWQVHFSQLGMAPDLAGFAFNYTLILTGVVIVTIADFLAHDLKRWLFATGQGRWKSIVVRVGLMVMGAALGGVGLLPVNVSHAGHILMTYLAVGAFVALALVAPVILRGIPRGFRIVSVATLAFVALLAYLFRGIRYLGTTGFEMLAVSTVLVWMVLFMRTISAARRDVSEGEATGAAGPDPIHAGA
ncbi:hypothetical protein [uncultured Tessaracoccus sp.]|uniref:hypothetical protein n=1 Tax=uncultured Tessaracoccus sp. TaxID=905023 RepID=UPI0025FB70E3|nr:hypothetical protein [uncultured Tessaracoccus sp.]